MEVNWNTPESNEDELRQAALRKLRQERAQYEALQDQLARYQVAANAARRFVGEYMAQSRSFPTYKQTVRAMETLGVTKKHMTPEQKRELEDAKGFDHLRVLADQAREAIQKADKA